MDDDEDFRALYFTECAELVEALQQHLEEAASGEGSEESIHAAFRAVHSVKGGAAAFGFQQLISFAHTFEAVMDLSRSGKLELTSELCELLLRASDTMETLIQRAQDEDDSPVASLDPVMRELQGYLGVEQTGAPAAAKAEAPAAAAPVAQAEPERTIKVHFEPFDSFFQSGFDMLKIIAAAKGMDMTSVEVEGDLPKIDAFSLETCPLSWHFTFVTSREADDLAAFFDIYEAAASYKIEVEEPEPPAPKAEKPAEAPAAAPAAPAAAAAPAPAAAAPAAAAPAKPAAGGKPAAGKSSGGKSEKKTELAKTLRVDLPRVDRLVNLVGEIAITQASLVQTFSESEVAFDADLEQTIEALSRQTRDLQDSVMAIRAQPVKVVFSRMPRVIRELSENLGKKVKLEIEGEHTEVDTTIIEELSEPLIHMLRNSMDHGLESNAKRVEIGKPEVGHITLRAEHRGERVVIILADDGGGINREKVHQKAIDKGLVSPEDKMTPEEIDYLIFHPGFSTADQVSSVSGRGVGMDVVRKKIVELGGRCTLKNEPGQGCTFTIALPLTLAVLDGMTVAVGGEHFILPLSNVIEATFLKPEDVKKLPDRSEVLARRGEYLKLLSVRQAFSMPGQTKGEQMAVIVDTETDGHIALRVDDLIGQRQVVLKSIEANYQRVEGVSGATILGDGRVALILDVPALIELSAKNMKATSELVH